MHATTRSIITVAVLLLVYQVITKKKSLETTNVLNQVLSGDGESWPWSSHLTFSVLTLMPVEVQNSSAMESEERWQSLRTMHLGSRWPCSVILHGLPLLGRVSFVPKHFHVLIISLTVDVEYTGGMKFHKPTYCRGGVLSQYHAWSHWALQNDPFCITNVLQMENAWLGA